MEGTLLQEHYNARVSAESHMQAHRLQDALIAAREAAQVSSHLAKLHPKHNVDAILDLILLVDILLAVEDPDVAYECMYQAEKLLHASLTAAQINTIASSTAPALVSAGMTICHCLEDFHKVRRAESIIGKVLEACTRWFGSSHSLTLKAYAEYARISQLVLATRRDAFAPERGVTPTPTLLDDEAATSDREADLDRDIHDRRVHDLIVKAGLDYVAGLEARQKGDLQQAVLRFFAAQVLYSHAIDNCNSAQLEPAFQEASEQLASVFLSLSIAYLGLNEMDRARTCAQQCMSIRKRWYSQYSDEILEVHHVLQRLQVDVDSTVAATVLDDMPPAAPPMGKPPSPAKCEGDVLAESLPPVPAMPPPAPPVRVIQANSHDGLQSQVHVDTLPTAASVHPSSIDPCTSPGHILAGHPESPEIAELALNPVSMPASPSKPLSELPSFPKMALSATASGAAQQSTKLANKDLDFAVESHNKALLAADEFLKRIHSILAASLLLAQPAAVRDIHSVSLLNEHEQASQAPTSSSDQIANKLPATLQVRPEVNDANQTTPLMSTGKEPPPVAREAPIHLHSDKGTHATDFPLNSIVVTDHRNIESTSPARGANPVLTHTWLVHQAQVDVVPSEALNREETPQPTISFETRRSGINAGAIDSSYGDNESDTPAAQPDGEHSCLAEDSVVNTIRAENERILIRKVSIDASAMHLLRIVAVRMWLAGLCMANLRHVRSTRMALKIWTVGLIHREIDVYRRQRVAAKLRVIGSMLRTIKEHRSRQVATKLYLAGSLLHHLHLRLFAAHACVLFIPGLCSLLWRRRIIPTGTALAATQRAIQPGRATGPAVPRTKTLYWDTIKDTKGTVFDANHASARHNIRVSTVFADLIDTFAAAPAAAKQLPAQPVTTQTQAVADTSPLVLDPKVQQNVTIALTKLGRPPFHRVVAAIGTADVVGLGGPEVVEMLLGLPTEVYAAETVHSVVSWAARVAATGSQRLSTLDRYIVEVVSCVQCIRNKLTVMQFVALFNEMYEATNSGMETFSAACKALKESDLLRTFLADVVLPLGNKLNEGTKKAGASGIRIKSLAQLPATKSSSGLNLLEYILVKLHDAQSPLLMLANDFASLREVVKAPPLPAIHQQVAKLRQSLGAAEAQLKIADAGETGFKASVQPFMDGARGRVTDLERNLEATQIAYEQTCSYFGEDAKVLPSDELFATLHEFMTTFASTVRKVSDSAIRKGKHSSTKAGESKSDRDKAAPPARASAVMQLNNELAAKLSLRSAALDKQAAIGRSVDAISSVIAQPAPLASPASNYDDEMRDAFPSEVAEVSVPETRSGSTPASVTSGLQFDSDASSTAVGGAHRLSQRSPGQAGTWERMRRASRQLDALVDAAMLSVPVGNPEDRR